MQSHSETITTPTTGSSSFWYDEKAAEKAVSFFPRFLKHVKGEWAGKPVYLEAWQADIIRQVFGWKREDGTRKYRTVYIEIPRKNGKSTLCAGIAPLLLFADKEPGAEVYSAAADRDQAAIVFEATREMIANSPDLSSRCEVYRRSIFVPSTASSYKVLSADAHTKHGLNSHGNIIDELHTQPNRDLVDVLETSTGARRQPLTVFITTAGFDRESICWEKHEYAVRVRDGVIKDDSFLPVIFAADEKDDWKDPKTWAKANPNFGISVKREYLEQECRRAQEVPAYENTFKRLHLNIWTEQAVRWMPMDVWDGCKAEYGEGDLLKQECFGGLDLASKTDIAAAVLLFTGEKWRILPYFWMPEDGLKKREERDGVPYTLWAKQGHLRLTPGNVIDFDFIRRDINDLGGKFAFREVSFDPWNATQLATQLQGDGFTMVEFRQGFASMSEPTKEMMSLCLRKQLEHNDNPVMNWMMANVAVEQDAAGNLKPSKKASKKKIDGPVALVNALGRAIVQEATAAPTVEVW